jgi:hypothetical protein
MFEENAADPEVLTALTRAKTYLASAILVGIHVLAVALSTLLQLVPSAFAQANH